MTKILLSFLIPALAAVLYIAGIFHRAENEHIQIQQYRPTVQDQAAVHGFDNAAKHLKEHRDP